MTPGKRFALSILLVASPLLGACSAGVGGDGGASGGATIVAVVQDLTADPSGQTTVVTLPFDAPSRLTPGSFEADGGQLATGVSVAGPAITVTWDERVTPGHRVRVLGIQGLLEELAAVTTSDPDPPTFVVTNGTQTAGLGGDSFSVEFSGAHLVESLVADLASWSLEIEGRALDLTGSSLAFDALAQRLDVTLGGDANLHASFDLVPVGVTSVADVALTDSVSGTASGDALAPTLISSEQDLLADEFGYVVVFTFSESMDPVFNKLGNFDAGFPVFVSDVAQPSEDVLRVSFTHPIVPGQDPIDLDVVDAHGNGLTLLDVPIAAGSTVANDFDAGSPTLTTVPNSGGDTVLARFVQALDPGTALDYSRWDLESPPGNDVDLSTATFAYDHLAKTLTITLRDDDLLNADGFTFQARAGTPPIDVDGQDFSSSFTGAISGDVDAPTVVSVIQNRVLDSSGRTFEVTFGEDVDPVQAELVANYSTGSGATVSDARLLPGRDVVRLELDAETVPGQHTLDVQNVVDLAGNAMGLAAALALGSTDGVGPRPATTLATADAGAENDQVTVVFDDDMLAVEVEDPLSWVLESPPGSALDTSLASVSYDAGARTGVLTFDGGDGVNLKNRAAFSLTLSTMRDIAGNVVDGAPVAGEVDAEDDFPDLESVWVETGAPENVHVRFDEPSELFDDALTTYVVRDALGLDVGGGVPGVQVDPDQRGATLTFAQGVVAGAHTLDVSGVTDLAGNAMFPSLLTPISTEDGLEPALEPGQQLYVAPSGESNDTLTIRFDRPMSAWNLLEAANFDLAGGADTADFEKARLSFDGDRTLIVQLDAVDALDLDNGAYTLTVDGILSAQGAPMTGASIDTATPDAGTDLAAAVLVAGATRLDASDPGNSVLIEMDEATDPADALEVSNYAIGGVNPTTVTRLGLRTVRGTWAGGVSVGQRVEVSVADLAGNAALASEAIAAADTAGPTLTGVAGVVVPGVGGDRIEITFSEPVTPASSLGLWHYAVTSGSASLDVGSMSVRYASGSNTIRLLLPESLHLREADTLAVTVTGVRNHAGLLISPPASVNGSIAGDGVAPGLRDAFVDWRADPSGAVVQLRFSEDMDVAFVTDRLNFASTGGQGVYYADLLRPDSVRLTFSGPLLSGDRIEVTGAPDLAGNSAGTIQIDPVF